MGGALCPYASCRQGSINSRKAVGILPTHRVPSEPLGPRDAMNAAVWSGHSPPPPPHTHTSTACYGGPGIHPLALLKGPLPSGTDPNVPTVDTPPQTHRLCKGQAVVTPLKGPVRHATGTSQGCISREGTSERRPQRRLGRRLEEGAKAVGAGYCRLQMPLKPALSVRKTVAEHRLGALEVGGGGAPRPFQFIPGTSLSDQPHHKEASDNSVGPGMCCGGLQLFFPCAPQSGGSFMEGPAPASPLSFLGGAQTKMSWRSRIKVQSGPVLRSSHNG